MTATERHELRARIDRAKRERLKRSGLRRAETVAYRAERDRRNAYRRKRP